MHMLTKKVHLRLRYGGNRDHTIEIGSLPSFMEKAVTESLFQIVQDNNSKHEGRQVN
jgi:hypothetical protein